MGYSVGKNTPFIFTILKSNKFNLKHVLDIGCGAGKYLKFLQSRGFKIDGIDSSETAVKMAKKYWVINLQ